MEGGGVVGVGVVVGAGSEGGGQGVEPLHPVHDQLAKRPHRVLSLARFPRLGHHSEVARNQLPYDGQAPSVGNGALDHLGMRKGVGGLVGKRYENQKDEGGGEGAYLHDGRRAAVLQP